MNKTFEQLAEDKPGTIYEDGYEEGIRYVILRGPSSLCAYLGISKAHPLSSFDYDSIPTISAHGGLTFSGTFDDIAALADMYWFGWDYGHSGDKSFYDLRFTDSARQDHGWTVQEVKKEIWWAAYEFKKICSLAEKILERSKVPA